MQRAFTRLTPIRQTWHPIGDAAGVRRIFRVWHLLMMRRHLAELPDDGHPYWSLQEILAGGQDHRAKMLRQPGAAYDVVAVDLGRLRELCESLEWLYDALKDDHEGKYSKVDGHWVVLDEVDDPPCTDLGEAKRACESIAAILDAAYERFVGEDV
ncbi:hypothetical protein [Rhizobium ruizarguesonis]|uniref:hypothetical protein n=1 Tax=Rhizobium ruizarguesonis TaxID=2081791 RepID=UPI00103167C3|nr:hypothetical protein [Rhizobium ruizarguesonis]TBA24748.1 hypothetical protein ELH61_02550 [Rhizobium ruizarguesonis]